MKQIFVSPQTFAIARALHEELAKRLGSEFLVKKQEQRMAATLFALRDLGSLTSHNRGCETWFYFDPEENAARNVLQIPLEDAEMQRSIELSERIMPNLEEIWLGKVKDERAMIDYSAAARSHEFEIDPFVSQMARWVDKEVIAKQPRFVAIDIAERMVRICLELQESGVAIKTAVKSSREARIVPVWVVAAAIDLRIGGAKVSQNERFAFSARANAAPCDRFQKVVTRHLKRRLASMLETQVAFFQLCNMGEIKIIAIDPNGHFKWGRPDDKTDFTNS